MSDRATAGRRTYSEEGRGLSLCTDIRGHGNGVWESYTGCCADCADGLEFQAEDVTIKDQEMAP